MAALTAGTPPHPTLAARTRAAREVGWLLVIFALSVLVRLPFLSVPMISDEGGYAYVAKFWGPGYELYKDIPFDRPQAIFFLYRACFWLFGPAVTDIRLFAAIYSGASALALFALCRRMLPRREAVLAASVFAVFSASPRIEGFTANAETFLLLPLIIAADQTWQRRWFWAGFAGALAVLVKPSGAAAALLTVSWLLVMRAGPGAWVRMAAGVAAGVLPSILHGAWVGWEYYWQSIHERRLVLYTAETMSTSAQLAAVTQVFHLTVSSWVFLAVASALALLRSRARYTFFGALWLAFSAMGVAMGGWWREHYFIQLVPALAFLASVGLSSLRGGPLRGLWIIALGLAALLFVRRDAALAFEAPRAISWHLYHRPGYLVAEPIARYIGEHTREDETIYVAFAEAEIYYLAGRRAAVPQFYYLHAQYSRRLFESIVDAIRSRTPALVVLVNDPPPNMMSRTTFLEILNANYVPRRDFRAFENFPAVTVFHRRAAGAD